MRRPVVAVVTLAVLAVAGCSTSGRVADTGGSGGAVRGATPGSSPGSGQRPAVSSYAVAKPGRFDGQQYSPDVLVTGAGTLPERVIRRVRAVPGVTAVLPFSVAAASINGRTLNVAAVDPGGFRRFTPTESAHADFVWNRVARGEVALDTSVSRKLLGKRDLLQLGTSEDSPRVRVGAFAPLVARSAGIGRVQPKIQAVVNVKRGRQLGIPRHNALLVSTGLYTPSRLEKQFEDILGDRATLQILALELDTAPQTAVLSGGSVSDAVGHFSYTNGPNGTIVPDRQWVHDYIRTEQVPIIGTVTGNKAMLPQLRWALREIQQRGLASKIHPGEYGGCYVPRYIGHNPAYGLSLHSWGIAVDLNVPGNQRGTAGEMDRTVVSIFKKWGFAWGGDWHYTDPMHFEMNRVVHAG
jgi:D-alanyl-D-alanine carboxypeptidase